MYSSLGAVRRAVGGIEPRRYLTGAYLYQWTVFVTVAGLIFLPLIFFLWGSVWTTAPGLGGHFSLAAYERAITNELFLSSVGNTLVLAALGTPIAMAIGVGGAILTTKTEIRGRRLLSTVLIIQFIMPGFITGIAWTTLWGPRGVINDLLVSTPLFSSPVIDIYSVWGIILTQGFASAPLAYLLTVAAVSSIPASLEEPGELNGASNFQTLWNITLPLILPTLTITGIIIVARMIQTFTIPLILGFSDQTFVLSTLIYAALQFSSPPLFALAAAIGVMLMAFIALLVIWQMRLSDTTEKYETLGGSESTETHIFSLSRRQETALSSIIGVVAFLYIAPAILLFIGSLQPTIFFTISKGGIIESFTLGNYETFLVGKQSKEFYRVLANSMIIGGGGAIFGMFVASVVSHVIVKSDFVFSKLLNLTTVVTTGIPGVVIGTTFLWIALEVTELRLYGTKALVIIAFTVSFIVYSTRATNSSFYSIGSGLEDSARISGASLFQMFRYIYLPLIKPGFMSGFILLFVMYMKVLTIPLFLLGPDNQMLQVMVWLRWARGATGETAALTVLMMGVIFLSYGLLYRFTDYSVNRGMR